MDFFKQFLWNLVMFGGVTLGITVVGYVTYVLGSWQPWTLLPWFVIVLAFITVLGDRYWPDGF